MSKEHTALSQKAAAIPRRRKKPEERKAEIMQAAIGLFARQGFERTTTREIALAASIAEGTIYKHFASKHEILFAFIQPKAFASVPLFFQDEADDEQAVRAFIEDRFLIWDQNRELMRVIIGEAFFNPALADVMNRLILPVVKVIEDYIARRMAAGSFRMANPHVVARAFVSYLMAYFLKWNLLAPTDETPIARQEAIDELTNLFLFGIKRLDDRPAISEGTL